MQAVHTLAPPALEKVPVGHVHRFRRQVKLLTQRRRSTAYMRVVRKQMVSAGTPPLLLVQMRRMAVARVVAAVAVDSVL